MGQSVAFAAAYFLMSPHLKTNIFIDEGGGVASVVFKIEGWHLMGW